MAELQPKKSSFFAQNIAKKKRIEIMENYVEIFRLLKIHLQNPTGSSNGLAKYQTYSRERPLQNPIN